MVIPFWQMSELLMSQLMGEVAESKEKKRNFKVKFGSGDQMS
jgi:hypothetical protein